MSTISHSQPVRYKINRLYARYESTKQNLSQKNAVPEMQACNAASDKAFQAFRNLREELTTNTEYYKDINNKAIKPLLLSVFIYVIYVAKTIGQATLISTIIPEILIATAILGSIAGFFAYTNNKYHQYKDGEVYHARLLKTETNLVEAESLRKRAERLVQLSK